MGGLACFIWLVFPWSAFAQDTPASLRGHQKETFDNLNGTKDASLDMLVVGAEGTPAASNASSKDFYAQFSEILQSTLTTEERDAVLFDTLVALGNQAQSSSGDACNSGLLGM